MTSQRWSPLLLLALLVTGWFLIQEWRQLATGCVPNQTPFQRQPETATGTLPEPATGSERVALLAEPTQALPLEHMQQMQDPAKAYVRGRMPDNLQSIRNADILEFDRKISPHTAGGEVYMHKLQLQPRDEEWAIETEKTLRKVTEQFYSAINSSSKTKIEALHVECRTDLCYVDLPYDSYWMADDLRRGDDRKADTHIYSLVGKDGEPFANQLVKNGVGTNYEDKSVARWVLAFDRGEDTASLYANSPPPG